MDETWLLDRLRIWVPLLLSLTVHEWAHAYSAFRLGDDTAMRMNRMTLNPMAHIDPIGTVLLPLMGVPFGWAKPVPVNPSRFRRDVSMRTGMMLTAAAGPASNVVLAVLCVIALGVMNRVSPGSAFQRDPVADLLWMGVLLNVILALFNMLPIPPLDGSRVADGLMPRRFEPAWQRFMQFGPLMLAAVIVMPFVLNVSLFAWPRRVALEMAMVAVAWIGSV